MPSIRKTIIIACAALGVALTAVPTTMLITPAAAAEIKYVVNGIPVTSTDIQRRAAFLKLQRKGGGAKAAGDEMVDQTLRMAEAKRLGIRVSDKQVDDAYARFAASNKMPLKALDQVMAQSGVTKGHFKDFIRAQMTWNQVMGARMRSQGGTMSEAEVVRKMMEKGGNKPSATEYMLQQVIFVVPAAERKATLGKRKREAEAMRARFQGCDTTRQFAKGLLDVTVRDLGRVLAPELPPDWAEQIKAAKTGGATPVRETERGVEFIGICSQREVSDDKVAQMVFQNEAGKSNEQADEFSKKLTAELRQRAKIVAR